LSAEIWMSWVLHSGHTQADLAGVLTCRVRRRRVGFGRGLGTVAYDVAKSLCCLAGCGCIDGYSKARTGQRIRRENIRQVR